MQVITRSRTGNLPPQRVVPDATADGATNKPTILNKVNAEELKEKMEQTLRMQRAAHQQKRALEMKNPQGQIVKVVGTTAQGKSYELFFICG